jgi:hypothetical protein
MRFNREKWTLQARSYQNLQDFQWKHHKKLWYDSIMKLTIHVLKDPRAGFKQARYMERFIWIGKNTGIGIFMDRLEILSTYLPLFPHMKGELLKELSDRQKATILYDALPHYYIKNIKEANTETIKCIGRTCSNLLSISKKLALTLESTLTVKRFKQKLETLDNEASAALKNFFTANE